MADNRPFYTLEDKPEYTDQVEMLLDKDPVKAQNSFFHNLLLRILNNIKAVKLTVDNDTVKNTGNETIDGKKTFLTAPALTGAPSTNTDLVNRGYVDDALATVTGNAGVVYKSLNALGLTNDDFDPGDLDSNMEKILNKLKKWDEIRVYPVSTTFSNLTASIQAYTGRSTTTWSMIAIKCNNDLSGPNPIYLYPNGTGVAILPPYFLTYDNRLSPCTQMAVTANIDTHDSNANAHPNQRGKMYTDLSQLGLSDSDMSATDFAGNIQKILGAMKRGDMFYRYTLYTNFAASADTYTNRTVSLWTLFLINSGNETGPSPVHLYPNSNGLVSQNPYFMTYDNVLTPPDRLAFGNWMTYTSVTDLGLAAGSETIEKICPLMRNYSTLYYAKLNGANDSAYPYNWGTLKMTRINSGRIECEFVSYINGSTTRKWIGTASTSDSGTIFTGWSEIITNTNTVKPTKIALPLASGITNRSSDGSWYWRDSSGQIGVSLDIATISGTIADGQVVANLPTGYRPSGTVRNACVPIYINLDTYTRYVGVLSMFANGEIGVRFAASLSINAVQGSVFGI